MSGPTRILAQISIYGNDTPDKWKRIRSLATTDVSAASEAYRWPLGVGQSGNHRTPQLSPNNVCCDSIGIANVHNPSANYRPMVRSAGLFKQMWDPFDATTSTDSPLLPDPTRTSFLTLGNIRCIATQRL